MRTLHNEKLRDLYSSQSIVRMNKSRRTRLGRACSTKYRLLAGKIPLGRPKCRWVDNIRMDLGEMGWGGVDWIGLTQDRDRWKAVVNAVMNLVLSSIGFVSQ
jgi:hypothetical protein